MTVQADDTFKDLTVSSFVFERINYHQDSDSTLNNLGHEWFLKHAILFMEKYISKKNKASNKEALYAYSCKGGDEYFLLLCAKKKMWKGQNENNSKSEGDWCQQKQERDRKGCYIIGVMIAVAIIISFDL